MAESKSINYIYEQLWKTICFFRIIDYDGYQSDTGIQLNMVRRVIFVVIIKFARRYQSQLGVVDNETISN